LPYWGQSLNDFTGLDIDFNAPVRGDSIDLSDITITNGVDTFAPTGWTLQDSDEVFFHFDVLPDGFYWFEIASGAFVNYQGMANDNSMYVEFTVDTLPPTVVSTSIIDGDGLATGTEIVFSATFSEHLNSYNNNGAVLINLDNGATYPPTDFQYDSNTFTSTYTFAPVPEGNYQARLFSNGNYDSAGNLLDGDYSGSAGGGGGGGGGGAAVASAGDGEIIMFGSDETDDYFVEFIVDNVSDPVFFSSFAPGGSLIFGLEQPGVFHYTGDVDEYTASIDEGQLLSIVLLPNDSSIEAQIEIVHDEFGVLATAVSGAPGQPVSIQNQYAYAGDYTIRITSLAGIGGFTIKATLNSHIETEPTLSVGQNDSIANAVSLEDSAVPLGGSSGERLAATGATASGLDADVYSFDLTAGQTATIALTELGEAAGVMHVTLLDSSGNVLANGASDAQNVGSYIQDFVANASDTYYLRVTGDAALRVYSLVVTREAAFEINIPDTIQTLTDGVLLGGSSGGSGSSGGGGIRVAIHGQEFRSQTIGLRDQLNDDTYFNFDAEIVQGHEIDTLAELSAYDVIVIGTQYLQHELDSIAPALRQFVEQGGGLVATGWSVYGGGPGSGGPVITDLDVVVPVQLTGSYSNFFNGTFNVTDGTHPVMQGLPSAFFVSNGAIEYPWSGADPGAEVLGTLNGNHVVVAGEPGDGRSVYLGPVYPEYDFTSGFADQLLEQAVAWTGSSGDQYAVELVEGQEFTVSTSTPGDGPDQPDNTLDPVLELYDSSGNLVASDDNSGNGLNALLTFTPGYEQTGTYYLKVGGTGGGAYVLEVSGTANQEAAFAVTATEPVDGGLLPVVFPTYRVHFSENILAGSVDASDLMVDVADDSLSGGIAADSVTFIDGNTV